MKEQYRLLSIIRNIDPANICAIVEVLLEEGIRCLEVSLSEPERGFGCLKVLRQSFKEKDFLLGAGTVSTLSEVDKLKEIGVSFFVTPGFDGALVDYAVQQGMKVIPGVLTPSDVQQAKNRGLELVKLFPANAYPMRYVKDLSGPFPHMRFMAVGGVGPDNLAGYLAAGFCGVGIGSSLVPQGAGPEQLGGIREAAARCVRAAY